MRKIMETEKAERNELKTILMNKYRELILDKMTNEDLEELKNYLTQEYDSKYGWHKESRKRFEQKLLMFMHEEIMRREIAGIETLLPLLTQKDLKQEKGA
jgi:hypothetical protein